MHRVLIDECKCRLDLIHQHDNKPRNHVQLAIFCCHIHIFVHRMGARPTRDECFSHLLVHIVCTNKTHTNALFHIRKLLMSMLLMLLGAESIFKVFLGQLTLPIDYMHIRIIDLLAWYTRLNEVHPRYGAHRQRPSSLRV